MEKLLYGAAYYDEYMPEERLDKDMELMKKASFNLIRIGESTWSTMEPHDGVFDFSHLTRVIEAAKKAGISVIIGTPTYAVPTWMVKKYPDILAETKAGRGIYGPRQIMDITNKTYRFYAERAIRRMMEAALPYENVIGVQIDNETKHYDTAGKNVQAGFVEYLKDKFDGDLEAMNEAFGLSYWSNRINEWEDFPDVRGTINASLGGEFEKYRRGLVTEFLSWQADIVREYLREGQFITHNTDLDWRGYSYGINKDTDVYANAGALDIAGVDIYHPSQDKLTGMEIAFGGDVTRSLKHSNYFVLETEAQGFPQWLPYKGQLRLQAYSHLASGANLVEYWHWHSLHNAIETYWKGVLSQDFAENAVYREASVVGNEFARIGKHLVNLKKNNKVAILISNESQTALEWFPVDKMFGEYGYNDVLMSIYEQLYKLNVECDFVWTNNIQDINAYELVIIPALYAASDEVLSVISEYVKGGGNVFATFKTGFSDENIKVWHDKTPHGLSECFGISYSTFTVPDGKVSLSKEYYEADMKPVIFMELLEANGAGVLSRYEASGWGEYAAVTENLYGKGRAFYLGCMLEGEALKRIISDVVKKVGIPCPETEFPVIIRKGTNDFGREIVYYLNYSEKEAVVSHAPGNGKDLITDKDVTAGEALSIGAWDLKIIEIE